MLDQLQPRLAAYYAALRPAATVGPLEELAGGWASAVYAFALEEPGAAPARLVLKTFEGSQAGRAHAEREWRALTGLGAAGYAVPAAHAFEPDPRTLGNPFVVIEQIAGEQLWVIYERAAPGEQMQLVQGFVARLAELHALAPQLLEPALSWPHSYAYIDRELAELRADAGRSAHASLAGVVAWLERRRDTAPCARPAILHRDYHPWNVLATVGGRLVVIDWDWRIGDPRFDLAWAIALMRRSGFDVFAAAVQAEYARQTRSPPGELAYFEALATLRWLLNVTHTIASEDPQRAGMRAAFREFLAEPVRRAAELLAERTGVGVRVAL